MKLPPPQSWDRMPDESNEDFRLFCVYRDMGPDRTLALLCAAIGLPASGTRPENLRIFGLHRKNLWRTRADAYDNWLSTHHKKGMEIAAQGLGAVEAHLREIHRTKEIHLVNLAFERCRDVLRTPLITDSYSETKRGKTIIHKRTVLTPAHYFAAATLMKAASQIGRQALHMDRQEEDDVTPGQFADLLYKTQTRLARDLPQGALPAPPVQVAQKPHVDEAIDNGNGQAPTAEKFRPPRVRPGENDQ